jgi:MFS transporter, ACS family, tartrate transporter
VAEAPANGNPDGTAGVVDTARVMRRVALRVLPFMAGAYFINSLDKTNLSVAALTMNDDLGITKTAFGLASGLFFIGYFVMEVPSNLIMHRVGARRWMSRIMISWGLVSALTALAQGAVSLDIFRVLLGLAEAGFYPGVLMYLTYWFPEESRARMLSLFVTGGSLSGILGPPLSAAIVGQHQILGIAGWRMMFLVEGVPALLLGLVALVVLTDRPEQASWLAGPDRQWLMERIGAQRYRVDAGRELRAFTALRNPRVVLLSVAYFCKCFGQYALAFFLPQMILAFEKSSGEKYSTFQVGLLTAVPSVVAVAAAIAWGWHSDRTGERIWHAAAPLLIGAVGIALSVELRQPVLILLALSVASMGIGSMSNSFFQLPSTFLTGAAAAAGLAMINAVGNLGGFAAPYFTGWLFDDTGSFTVACWVMGGFMALGAVGILVFSGTNRAGRVAPAVVPSGA